eukprot:scaffold12845_cov25-Prasinocladus_malaysianus.AAC.1
MARDPLRTICRAAVLSQWHLHRLATMAILGNCRLDLDEPCRQPQFSGASACIHNVVSAQQHHSAGL